jgi:hypothetical protein
MPAVQLTDELAQLEYFLTFPDTIAGLTNVCSIDADDNIITKVQNFLSNERITGMVLFFGIYDGGTRFAQEKTEYVFNLTLSVLKQAPDKLSDTLAGIRKDTRECLLACLGKVITDYEESAETLVPLRWHIERPDERFIPSGEMANAMAYGFTTNLDIVCDLGHIVFPL